MNDSRGQPRRRPHVLMVAYGSAGHYFPFLHLLHECALYEGVTVTLACNEERIAELRSLQAKGEFSTLDLRLEVVFTPGHAVDLSNPNFQSSAWATSIKRRKDFEPFLNKLMQEKDLPGSPTCMVADNLSAIYSQDAASRLGIPWYPLFVATTGYLTAFTEGPTLRELRRQSSPGGHKPLDIPGLEFLRLRDLPLELFSDPLDYVSPQADIFSKASAIVFNTVAELDRPSGTMEGIRMSLERRASAENRSGPKIFCIGPMLNFPGFRGPGQSNVLKSASSSASLTFLNTHAPASVLYVCFGSLSKISAESVTELAHGLEASGVPFLWVLRMSDFSQSVASLLPPGFQDRLKGRCFIEEVWAPQAEVLLHPSTGGFLSHCGWNSVHESFCTAMPLITWPIGAEQQISARFVEKISKTGIPVRHFAPEKDIHEETTWEVLPTRGEIQRAITFLMIAEEGKELKKNAVEMKKIVTEAVTEDGSSNRSLRIFLDEILLQSTRRTK